MSSAPASLVQHSRTWSPMAPRWSALRAAVSLPSGLPPPFGWPPARGLDRAFGGCGLSQLLTELFQRVLERSAVRRRILRHIRLRRHAWWRRRRWHRRRWQRQRLLGLYRRGWRGRCRRRRRRRNDVRRRRRLRRRCRDRRCWRGRCRLHVHLRRRGRRRGGGGGGSTGSGFGGSATGGAGGAASCDGAGTLACSGACIDDLAVPVNTIATAVSGGASSFGAADGRPSSRNRITATCTTAEMTRPIRKRGVMPGGLCPILSPRRNICCSTQQSPYLRWPEAGVAAGAEP